MTKDEFDALIARLEIQAARDPAAYQRRVTLLALLGNVYLGALLLVIVAILIALAAYVMVLKAIGVKLFLVVSAFLVTVFRALWIRVSAPVGREVHRHEAPDLFAMIEALGRELQAPHFHHAVIDDEMNAAVAQVSRLGVFGWYRNHLVIGLPLMKSLTIEQFKAALAHEFGHLARGHGRVGNWIYCQRLRWLRLTSELQS